MISKEYITACYVNAREQIKLGNAREARGYILKILNAAVSSYYAPEASILSRAKTAAFMDKWLAVSRVLYEDGITEWVRRAFGLAEDKPALKSPVGRASAAAAEGGALPVPDIEGLIAPEGRGEETAPAEPAKSGLSVPASPVDKLPAADIDYSGLIAESADKADWVASLFEANRGAVVRITIAANGSLTSGTGFIISPNGYLLTNDHVVFDEATGAYHSKVKMSFEGEKKSYKVDVLFSDKSADVALCSFKPAEVGDFKVIKRISDYSKVRAGAECMVIGNMFGQGLSPCMGNIRYTKSAEGNIVYTVPSNPGDSGGPVFIRSGECIGIHKSKTTSVNSSSADGVANATPMDRIDALLKKWTECNDITL